MSNHDASESSHPAVPARVFVWIWVYLVVLTGIEVYMGYIDLPARIMLTVLMGISIIKAGLIMSWFMHLKYEKRTLTLWLVPAAVFCIGMMLLVFFWDSLRLAALRPH
jgi:cytochrome c oxidase subunit IV